MPRVLHIEDDPANRLLVRKLLAPAGFEVVDAMDGLDGVRKATDGAFDLILVDIAIPGLDGYEVTLRLRSEESLKEVPIIAITAEGSRNTSLSVGCDGFLQKPIDARTFVQTLKGYLKGQREGVSVETSGEHLRVQSQRIVGHLEQKVAELSAANARLVELDEARKEFYRNISHELSTPMTPIVGYTKLLLDQELGALNPSQHKALGALSACVQRLRSLIDNLLDVTGIETGRLRFASQSFDLLDCLRNAASSGEAVRAKKAQVLRLALPVSGPLPFQGDQGRIQRAVEQLLENANKFCPDGTQMLLSCRSVAQQHYEIVVADQGPGVPDFAKGRIFDPFYQADGSPTRSQGGTGVGLALARGVARGHRGDLALCSEPIVVDGATYAGACFMMTLGVRPDVVSQ